MQDMVILDSLDMARAQRATSAFLGVVLAGLDTTVDRWVVLDTLATGPSPSERSRLVPALAAALATGPDRLEAVLDDAEAAGLVRVVSAPGGDVHGVRVELTDAGEAQHTTLRSAVDRAAAELCAGIPDHDLAAAHRVLDEVTRRADGWMQFWAAARPAGVAG